MSSTTLAQSLAARLRDAVLRGQYLPGERLVELTLAREMGVSQNTVRDALRILEQEGWVVKHARRGVHVRKFTAGEAAEIYALLAAVEGLVVGWAAEAMSQTHLSVLRRLLKETRRLAHRGDMTQAIELLFAFHETVARVANKPLTAEVLAWLYNQARLLERLRQARAPRSLPELEAQIEAHAVLLEAMETGDEGAARAALRAQITAYQAMLLPVLAET